MMKLNSRKFIFHIYRVVVINQSIIYYAYEFWNLSLFFCLFDNDNDVRCLMVFEYVCYFVNQIRLIDCQIIDDFLLLLLSIPINISIQFDLVDFNRWSDLYLNETMKQEKKQMKNQSIIVDINVTNYNWKISNTILRYRIELKHGKKFRFFSYICWNGNFGKKPTMPSSCPLTII